MNEYLEFLQKKMYLIESTARKFFLKTGNAEFKEILELCNMSPSKVNEIYRDKLGGC